MDAPNATFFTAYGGWTLYPYRSEIRAAQAASEYMLSTFTAKARVVEVEIYFPATDTYEHDVGFTVDKRIPPHRREHRDGDAKVTVKHLLTITQGDD